MSDDKTVDVGKALREENMAKFEGDITPMNKPDSGTPSVSGFGELASETAKQNAGKGFSQDAMFESPFANDHFNSKLLGFDLGEVMGSQYEEKGYTDVLNPHIDFEAMKADNQSAFSKIGALTTQFIGKTAVGTVGNIVGSFYGLGEMAFSEDGDINSLWDNAVYRTLDEANASIEAKNSIFVNNKQGLGFNFKTFKEVNDAFSFIAGAAISEMIMQTAGNLVGGAGAISLPLRLTRYGKQMGRIMKMVDKAEDIERMGMKLGWTVEEMSHLNRINNVSKAIMNNGRRALTTTGYEASLEARGAKDQLMSDMTAELEYEIERTGMKGGEAEAFREQRMKEIEEAANSAGMMTFGLNTAVLGISNAMQFPQIFGNNFNKSLTTGSLIRKGINDISQKQGKKAAIKRGFSTMGRVLKNPITEFGEETFQGLASKFSYNHYELMMGDRSQAGVLAPYVNNVGDSVLKAVQGTYGTAEGLHEGVIGAIVGSLGIPGLKKHGKGRKLTLNGGIAEGIRDEKSRRKDIADATASLNAMPLSDVASYNKDASILAALDPQSADYAAMTNNKVAFESTQDNKVYRYTMDRLEKNMEGFIEEDIAEMNKMIATDFDKYKKTFDKDDTFTKEEAQKEVEDFQKKVEIYSKAYKAVHKRFSPNLMRQDNVSKKLVDTLTYAVATEQVYGARLEKVKENLVNTLNGKFTKEEIDMFVETSGKVGAVQNLIDDYISGKNKDIKQKPLSKKELESIEEVRQELKAQAGTAAALLNESKANLEFRLKELEASTEKGEDTQESIADLKTAISLKDKYDNAGNEKVSSRKEFKSNKSSTVRKMTTDLDELAAAVNEEIEKETSRAMKAITKPKKGEKVTRKELEPYIKQKSEIIKGINEAFNAKGVFQLSQEDHETAGELIQEMHEVTDRYNTSVEVAAYLYGFKNNPSKAYAKISAAQFYADFDNASRISRYMDSMLDEEPTEEFRALYEEFNDIIENMSEELKEIEPALDKELVVDFKVLRNKLKRYKTFLRITQELDEQNKNAKDIEKDEKPDEPDTSGAVDFGDTLQNGQDNPPAGNPDGDTKNPKTSSTDKDARVTIKEDHSFVKKYHPEFKELINEGKIKYNAATTITVLTEKMDPSKDVGLRNYLIEENELDSYVAGMDKIAADPTVLNKKSFQDLDPDVYTFIRHAPVQMDVYDKVLDPQDDYKYDITTEDTPVFTQKRFFAADDLLTLEDQHNKEWEKLNEEMDKLDAEQEKELAKIKNSKEDTRTRVNLKYKKLKQDAYAKTKAFGDNSKSNFKFRHQLIRNAFVTQENVLKLRVLNVDQGDFQSFNFEKDIIREESPETLKFDPNTMTIEDIFYGTSSTEYGKGTFHDLNGSDTSTMDNPPFGTRSHEAINGKLFFRYRNLSGKNIPIKMNTSTIDKKHIKIMYKVLEDFFKSEDKAGFRVKNTGIPFIDAVQEDGTHMKLNDFLSFFLRQKADTSSPHVIFLKNTFNVKPSEVNPGEFQLQFSNGDVDSMLINNLKELEKLKVDFFSEMAQNRFTINKKFLATDGKINKDVLNYYFDNSIISHTFDVENNFDKIYRKKGPDGKPYNKGITLSNIDTPDTPVDIDTSEGYGNMINELRKNLGGTKKKGGDYQANLTTINSSMLNSILKSISKQAASLDHNVPTDAEYGEMLDKAVENTIASRLKYIQYVIDRKPYKKTAGLDHENSFKIDDTDTEVDKFLKVIYAFKKTSYASKSFRLDAIKEAKTWGSKTTILNGFETATKAFPLNEYEKGSGRRNNAVRSQLTTKEQFDNIMEMVYLMKDLAENEKENGKGFMYITYSEDYRKNIDDKGNPRSSKKYKVIDKSNLTKSNKVKNDYKTRLSSVTIDGVPTWKDGKIVGGSVFLNTKDWNRKTKKEGTDQIILFADSESETPDANIITSIGLPFMNVDYTLKDEISELVAATDLRKKSRSKNNKKIIIDTQKAIGRLDLDVRNLSQVDDVDTEGWGENSDQDLQDAWAASGVIDTDAPKDTPAVPPASADISKYNETKYSEIIVPTVEDALIFFEQNSMDAEYKKEVKEDLEEMGIKSPDQLVLIYDSYKAAGIVDASIKIDKFAEYIYGTKIISNC